MNVQWTEAALDDLQAVEVYIARRSPQYARSLVERIFSRSGLLEAHPLLGTVVHEYDDPSIREMFENPYRIVYRFHDDRIDILAVVHSSRRMPTGLQ